MENVIHILEIGKGEILKEINKVEMFYVTGSSPLNLKAFDKFVEEKRMKIKFIEKAIKLIEDIPQIDLQTEPGTISTIKYKDKIIPFAVEELEAFLREKYSAKEEKK